MSRVLQQIVTALVLALLSWLEKKHAESKKPVNADRRADALSRIGQRVRMWEDGDRARGLADASRAGHDGQGVPPDRR